MASIPSLVSSVSLHTSSYHISDSVKHVLLYSPSDDRGLLISPFVPFLALLGAAISNPGYEADEKLLTHVVFSLKQAAESVPGAQKLYDICHVLHRTALKTIEEAKARNNWNTTTANSDQSGIPNNLTTPRTEQVHQDASVERQGQMVYGNTGANMDAFTMGADPQSTLSTSDNANEISSWFENYMGGSTSMLDMLEMDQLQMNWDWDNM